MNKNKKGIVIPTTLLIIVVIAALIIGFYKYSTKEGVDETKNTQAKQETTKCMLREDYQYYDNETCEQFIENYGEILTIDEDTIIGLRGIGDYHIIVTKNPESEISIGTPYFFNGDRTTKLTKETTWPEIDDIKMLNETRMIVVFGGAPHLATTYLINTESAEKIPFTDPNGYLLKVEEKTNIPFGRIADDGSINTGNIVLQKDGFTSVVGDVAGEFEVTFTYDMDGVITNTNVVVLNS